MEWDAIPDQWWLLKLRRKNRTKIFRSKFLSSHYYRHILPLRRSVGLTSMGTEISKDSSKVPNDGTCMPYCCTDCSANGVTSTMPSRSDATKNFTKQYRDWADKFQVEKLQPSRTSSSDKLQTDPKTSSKPRESNIQRTASSNKPRESTIQRTTSGSSSSAPSRVPSTRPSPASSNDTTSKLRRAARSFAGALPDGWDEQQLQELQSAVEEVAGQERVRPPGFCDMQAIMRARDLGTRTPLKIVYGPR